MHKPSAVFHALPTEFPMLQCFSSSLLYLCWAYWPLHSIYSHFIGKFALTVLPHPFSPPFCLMPLWIIFAKTLEVCIMCPTNKGTKCFRTLLGMQYSPTYLGAGWVPNMSRSSEIHTDGCVEYIRLSLIALHGSQPVHSYYLKPYYQCSF